MMTGMESEQAAEQIFRKLWKLLPMGEGWMKTTYNLFDFGLNRITATLVVFPAHGDGITGCPTLELETDIGIFGDTAAE